MQLVGPATLHKPGGLMIPNSSQAPVAGREWLNRQIGLDLLKPPG